MTTKVSRRRDIQTSPRLERLTPRGRECLLLAALGKRTKEIAEILSITPETINEYVRSALKKLGAHSRTQAVSLLLGDE